MTDTQTPSIETAIEQLMTAMRAEVADEVQEAANTTRWQLVNALNSYLNTDNEGKEWDPDEQFDEDWLDGFRAAIAVLKAHSFI